jgi:hypothetical protein
MKSKELYEDYPQQGSTICTFQIQVKFIRNATWQGEIRWIEENKKQNFRSDLEMIKLMDEALTEATGEQYPISWEG